MIGVLLLDVDDQGFSIAKPWPRARFGLGTDARSGLVPFWVFIRRISFWVVVVVGAESL